MNYKSVNQVTRNLTECFHLVLILYVFYMLTTNWETLSHFWLCLFFEVRYPTWNQSHSITNTGEEVVLGVTMSPAMRLLRVPRSTAHPPCGLASNLSLPQFLLLSCDIIMSTMRMTIKRWYFSTQYFPSHYTPLILAGRVLCYYYTSEGLKVYFIHWSSMNRGGVDLDEVHWSNNSCNGNGSS